MQTLRTVLLAGAAAVLVTTACGVAAAKGPETHVVTVRLPGGAIEEIRYAGDIAPQVVVTPEYAPIGFGWLTAFFGPDSAFAEINRISTAMDRQMDAMVRNAQALAADHALVTEIDAGKLPPGSQSYSFVSTMSGSGVCGKSVEITSRGDGQKPQVVSKTWGDCSKGDSGAGANSLAPAQSGPSGIREIRYEPRTPAPAPAVREAGLF